MTSRLDAAMNEGRNIVPDATDDQANLIEEFAAEVAKTTLTLPELPAGWHFDGLWHDGFVKDPDKQYSADASFPMTGDTGRLRHLEVTAEGPTMQAALDALPGKCIEAIRSITESKEWLDAHKDVGAELAQQRLDAERRT